MMINQLVFVEKRQCSIMVAARYFLNVEMVYFNQPIMKNVMMVISKILMDVVLPVMFKTNLIVLM